MCSSDLSLSELYPSMVDGPLWRMYHEVLASGVPGRLTDFRYEEKRTGIVSESLFDVSVYPERRERGPVELIDSVRENLAAASVVPGEEALVRLHELLYDPSPDDGTCTLAVRVRS